MAEKQINRTEHFHRLEGPQNRGDAAEAIIRAEFTVRGLTVLRPENDNTPYDFVLETDEEFYRIQSKTAYDGENKGAVRFETRSTRIKRQGYERESYKNKIEYFAVYNPENGDIYIISIHEATEHSMTIRYEPPANGSWKNINWHEDYQLDTVLLEL